MRGIVIAALLALSAIPAAAAASDTPRERQFCTRIEIRSGSHMGYRRVCKTASQWRQALGPDWRQSVSGARGVQDEVEAMTARMSPDNEVHGQQVDPNSPGAHAPSPN